MEENHFECITAINTVQLGTTCLLASTRASDYTGKAGYKVFAKVDRNSIGEKLIKCIHFVDSICLLTNNISISSDLALFDKNFTGQRNEFHGYCSVLQQQYNDAIILEKEENLTMVYEILIRNIFPPYNYDFYPILNFTGKMENDMMNVKDMLVGLFSINEEESIDAEGVYLRPIPPCEKNEDCEEGEKIYRYGKGNELPRVTPLSSLITTTILTGFLLKAYF